MSTITLFIDMMAAERGASQNSLSAYRRDLLHLWHYISVTPKSTNYPAESNQPANSPPRRETIADWQGCNRGELEGYLGKLAQQGFSPRTIARRRSVMRQFFGFLIDEGLIEQDPTHHLAAQKLDRPLPKILSAEAIEAMITHAAALHTAKGKRLVLQLELLWGSGLRVSELLGLSLNAIQPATATIQIRGKGGRERIVPVTDAALNALADYLTVRTSAFLAAGQQSPWLFPIKNYATAMGRSIFSADLKQLAIESGLDPALVSPHVLRHACATHMLEGGANLREVQTMLGHADIGTTEIYTHLAIGHLESLVLEHHPLARHSDRPRRGT